MQAWDCLLMWASCGHLDPSEGFFTAVLALRPLCLHVKHEWTGTAPLGEPQSALWAVGLHKPAQSSGLAPAIAPRKASVIWLPARSLHPSKFNKHPSSYSDKISLLLPLLNSPPPDRLQLAMWSAWPYATSTVCTPAKRSPRQSSPTPHTLQLCLQWFICTLQRSFFVTQRSATELLTYINALQNSWQHLSRSLPQLLLAAITSFGKPLGITHSRGNIHWVPCQPNQPPCAPDTQGQALKGLCNNNWTSETPEAMKGCTTSIQTVVGLGSSSIPGEESWMLNTSNP